MINYIKIMVAADIESLVCGVASAVVEIRSERNGNGEGINDQVSEITTLTEYRREVATSYNQLPFSFGTCTITYLLISIKRIE